MPTVRIPLVGSLLSRDGANTQLFGSSQKDQFFKDCIFSVTQNSITGKTTAKVGARRSFTEYTIPTAASGNGTALRLWRGPQAVVSAFGSTNSTIYQTDTSLGAITGLAIHLSETTISDNPTLLIVSDANRAWYYPSGGALTEITDTDFPAKQTPALTLTGNFAQMDGYAFIMCTNGQIWHSDVNSVVNWTSTATITAQEYPDRGMGVARYRNFIVAFSRYSMEFFINAGNAAGAVLQRVSHMARQIGLVNQFCLNEVKDELAFVGWTNQSIGVFMLRSNEPTKISNQTVETWLSEEVQDAGYTGDNLRMHILADRGRHYIAVGSSSNAKKYMVYDIESNIWHPWEVEYGIRMSDPIGGSTIYVGENSTKQIRNNSGALASAVIQTQALDFGTKNLKSYKSLRVIGDKANTTANLTISWSDDDGQTFSTGRTVDMSANNPQLKRLGLSRRRNFKITGLGAADTNREQMLEALEIEYDVGAL